MARRRKTRRPGGMLRQQPAQTTPMADKGRREDDEVAHVAEGEVVLPANVRTPEFMANVRQHFEQMGVPLDRYTVQDTDADQHAQRYFAGKQGGRQGLLPQANPQTGQQAFNSLPTWGPDQWGAANPPAGPADQQNRSSGGDGGDGTDFSVAGAAKAGMQAGQLGLDAAGVTNSSSLLPSGVANAVGMQPISTGAAQASGLTPQAAFAGTAASGGGAAASAPLMLNPATMFAAPVLGGLAAGFMSKRPPTAGFKKTDDGKLAVEYVDMGDTPGNEGKEELTAYLQAMADDTNARIEAGEAELPDELPQIQIGENGIKGFWQSDRALAEQQQGDNDISPTQGNRVYSNTRVQARPLNPDEILFGSMGGPAITVEQRSQGDNDFQERTFNGPWEQPRRETKGGFKYGEPVNTETGETLSEYEARRRQEHAQQVASSDWQPQQQPQGQSQGGGEQAPPRGLVSTGGSGLLSADGSGLIGQEDEDDMNKRTGGQQFYAGKGKKRRGMMPKRNPATGAQAFAAADVNSGNQDSLVDQIIGASNETLTVGGDDFLRFEDSKLGFTEDQLRSGDPEKVESVANELGISQPDPTPPPPPPQPTPSNTDATFTSPDLNTQSNTNKNDSVENRLDSLLESSNPLMEKAGGRARQGANQRGLLNSSMATQAGQSAMVDAALPVAQQDAETAAEKNLLDQQYRQDRAMLGAEYQNQSALADQQFGNQMELQQAQDAAAKERLGLQLTSEEQRLSDELASREELQTEEYEYREDFLEMELGSRERIQHAEDAAAKERLGMQLSAEEEIALAELESAEARLDAELESRETIAEQQTEAEKEIAELEANVSREIANLEVSDNERQAAIDASTDVQNMYNQAFATISQNPNIPADVREDYLDHIMAVQEKNLDMIEDFYDIELDW